MIAILNDNTAMKKILKEGSMGMGVELGHMSKEDIVPRDRGLIRLKIEIFIFAFKNSEMSIIEHGWSV